MDFLLTSDGTAESDISQSIETDTARRHFTINVVFPVSHPRFLATTVAVPRAALESPYVQSARADPLCAIALWNKP